MEVNVPAQKKPPIKVLSFRIERETAETLEALARKNDLCPSDFLRAMVLKALPPAKEREDARAAALEALSPAGRGKALRALAIKKKLGELRFSQAVPGVLDDIFEDASATAGQIRDLELEFAALRKELGEETAGLASLSKDKGAKAGPLVYRTDDLDDDEAVAAEPETDAPETDEPGAEGLKKTAADEKADRFLELSGLMASLRELVRPRGFLDSLGLGEGPSLAGLLVEKIRAECDGGLLDEKRFVALREVARRVLDESKKLRDLEAADLPTAAPMIAELKAGLASTRADLLAEAGGVARKVSSGAKPGTRAYKKKGLLDWDNFFDRD